MSDMEKVIFDMILFQVGPMNDMQASQGSCEFGYFWNQQGDAE